MFATVALVSHLVLAAPSAPPPERAVFELLTHQAFADSPDLMAELQRVGALTNEHDRLVALLAVVGVRPAEVTLFVAAPDDDRAVFATRVQRRWRVGAEPASRLVTSLAMAMRARVR